MAHEAFHFYVGSV